MTSCGGCEVFVGGLGQSCNEEELKVAFSEFGRVVDVRLSRRGKGVCKGFGFVTFHPEDTTAAVRATKGLSQVGNCDGKKRVFNEIPALCFHNELQDCTQ